VREATRRARLDRGGGGHQIRTSAPPPAEGLPSRLPVGPEHGCGWYRAGPTTRPSPRVSWYHDRIGTSPGAASVGVPYRRQVVTRSEASCHVRCGPRAKRPDRTGAGPCGRKRGRLTRSQIGQPRLRSACWNARFSSPARGTDLEAADFGAGGAAARGLGTSHQAPLNWWMRWCWRFHSSAVDVGPRVAPATGRPSRVNGGG
jgi:hypothetical protein